MMNTTDNIYTDKPTGDDYTAYGYGPSRSGWGDDETTNRPPEDAPRGMDSGRSTGEYGTEPLPTQGRTGNSGHPAPPDTRETNQHTAHPPTTVECSRGCGEQRIDSGEAPPLQRDTQSDIEEMLDSIERELQLNAPGYILDEFRSQRRERQPSTQGSTATEAREQTPFDWDAPIIPLISDLPGEETIENTGRTDERHPGTNESSVVGGNPPPEANQGPEKPGKQRGKRKRGSYKIATLNIKGGGSTNSLDKWRHINQLMRENTVDVLVVQETHLDDARKDEIQQLFERRMHILHSWNGARQNADGIAIVLNKGTTRWAGATATEIVRGRALAVTLPWDDKTDLAILGVYAPNQATLNAEFWQEVQRNMSHRRRRKPDIVLGDFNMVEESLDRLPPHPDAQTTVEALHDMKRAYGIRDGWREANPTTLKFTFRAHDIQSRLDRIYMNDKTIRLCHQWQLSHTAIKTDHKMASVEVLNPELPYIGKGRYAAPVALLANRKLTQKIMEVCKGFQESMAELDARQRTPERNAQTVHKRFKTDLLACIRAFSREYVPKLDKEIEALERDQDEVLRSTDQDDEIRRVNAALIDERISQLEKIRHFKNRDNIAARATLEGETLGKYWINQNKEKKPRDTIPAFSRPEIRNRDVGRHRRAELTNVQHPRPALEKRSDRMASLAREYHDGIQRVDMPNPEELENETNEVLGTITTKIQREDKANLAKYLSEDEVAEAIRDLPNGKAAGLDGIPQEIWKKLLKRYEDDKKAKRPSFNIVQALTKVYNDIEEYGVVDSTRFAEGWMCPIYKKGEKTEVSNYRPITVLNTDYKIFTKALTGRLTSAVPAIIHKDQAGFMKGRRIEDQTELIKLIISRCEQKGERGAVVCLDQEKAYDKISHAFLWKSLEKFDFPAHFIRTVRTIYESAETVVIINGVISTSYKIIRGVRQGDPMSCLLFNIAIESLAQMLRSSDLKGFNIKGREERLVTTLFADDTTVYLSEDDTFQELQSILGRWCRVSGAKFNVPKTIVIPIGSPEYRKQVVETRRLNENHEPIPDNVKIAKDGEPVRALGAYVGNMVQNEGIWTPTVEKITADLERWSKGHPTQDGKRHIINMVVGGRTQYLTRVQGMPQQVEKLLIKMIREFVWGSAAPPPVGLATLSRGIEDGGKRILDLKARNQAIELHKLKTYLNFGPERPAWAMLADEAILENTPLNRSGVGDSGLLSPYLQKSKITLRTGNTTLPDNLVRMVKTGKSFNVEFATDWMDLAVQRQLPMWHHLGVRADKRLQHNDQWSKCHRGTHRIRTVGETQDLAETLRRPDDEHTGSPECPCDVCTRLKSEGCTYPTKCIRAAGRNLDTLESKWDPRTREGFRPRSGNEEEATQTFERHIQTRDDLKNGFRVFGALNAQGMRHGGEARNGGPIRTRITVFISSKMAVDADGYRQVGYGTWIADKPEMCLTRRLPEDLDRTTRGGRLLAIAEVAATLDRNAHLDIRCDDEATPGYILGKAIEREEEGWLTSEDTTATQRALASLRARGGTTTISHDATGAGTRHAKRLADEGARDRNARRVDTGTLRDYSPPGARLVGMTQAKLYKGILLSKKTTERRTTTVNLDITRHAMALQTGTMADDKEIWASLKCLAFTKRFRAFLWKSMHGAYKVGDYWLNKEGLERRGDCHECGVVETMEHIVLECECTGAKYLWDLAEKLWDRKSLSPWPAVTIGTVLGSGLLDQMDGQSWRDKGERRLYQILVSETTHLIWKARCDWRIGKKSDKEKKPTRTELTQKWWSALDKRLRMDCLTTNAERYGKRAIKPELVTSTWTKIVDKEDLLGDDWYRKHDGVLVGRGEERPRGRNR